jgi:hypothetical protein
MKNLKFIPAVLFACVVMLSCNSDDNEPVSCEDASAAVIAAGTAYNNATAENFVELCNDYKDALENQISSCGDENGILQDMVDGLDCTEPTTNGLITFNLGSAPVELDVITVTTTGTTRHVHAEKSTTTTYELDFDVEVGQTGANKINNFQLRLMSQTFTPLIPAAFGNDWESNITVNSATSVVGTFHGELVNASETSVQDLLGGVVDIDF